MFRRRLWVSTTALSLLGKRPVFPGPTYDDAVREARSADVPIKRTARLLSVLFGRTPPATVRFDVASKRFAASTLPFSPTAFARVPNVVLLPCDGLLRGHPL